MATMYSALTWMPLKALPPPAPLTPTTGIGSILNPTKRGYTDLKTSIFSHKVLSPLPSQENAIFSSLFHYLA